MFVLCKCSISLVFFIWWTAERTSGLPSTKDKTPVTIVGPRPSEGTAASSHDAAINITTEVLPRTSLAASSRAANQNPGTSQAASLAPAFDNDYVLTEIVRLVFKGNVGTAGFPDTIYGLTESFLTRATRELKAEDGSDWSYELSSTLQPISYENVTTYMDFRIKHTAQRAIVTVFHQLGFSRFVSQNSHLVLISECWPHKNCQNGSVTASSQPTELEKSFNLITTLIVLCSLCLVIILTGVVCSCLKRMDSSKPDTDFETKDFAETSQRILVKPCPSSESPAVPTTPAAQTTSFYASAADEDEDVETLHSTLVIQLGEAPGREAAVLVITAQDTKL